jgi:hypothetical protein
MLSEFGGDCTKSNSPVGEDVHTCTSLVFIWSVLCEVRTVMEETNDGTKIAAVTDCVFCEVRAESLQTVGRLNITERDVRSLWDSGRITATVTERSVASAYIS